MQSSTCCISNCHGNKESKKKESNSQHLSSDKASGVDAIPVMIYNAGGLPMAEKLTYLFQCMWMMEAITDEFNDAFIICL